MSKEGVDRFRTFGEVELDLFVAHLRPAAELAGRVDAYASEFPHGVPRERVEWLKGLIAKGKPSRPETRKYAEKYGVAGVQRFITRGKRKIYSLPIETFPNHVNNTYLILDGHGGLATSTLIDVGTKLPTTMAGFERAFTVLREVWDENVFMDELDNVILTHAHIDHFGNIAWHRENSKAKVFIHELDARVLTNFKEVMVMATKNLEVFMRRAGLPDEDRKRFGEMYFSSKEWFQPVTIDRMVADDEEIIREYKVIHVPGHCPGHICLMVDNVMFSGDHIIDRITPHQAPESITAFMGLKHYIDSLRKVQKIGGIDLILSGHEKPITNPYERIHEIIASHQERLTLIQEFTRSQSRTLHEITLHLFPTQKDYGQLLALEEAGAHVEYLHQRGHLAIANLDEVARAADPVFFYGPGPNPVN